MAINSSRSTGARPEITMFKSDRVKNMSADLMKKHYGDKNMGEILNEVSDPNFSRKKGARNAKNKLGKEAFLKLLLTQLKHQDPMNPMESHDMAAQLAQFTSLEKLDGIDSGINKLSANNNHTQSFDSLSLIGKTITGDGSKLIRSGVEKSHNIKFTSGRPIKSGSLEIVNNVGETIFSKELMTLKQGQHDINWNGLTNDGVAAPKGDYLVVVSGVDPNGRSVDVETQFSGEVTGVNFTSNGPVLAVGNQMVPLRDVKAISSPVKQKQIRQVPAVQSQPAAQGPAAQKVQNTNINVTPEVGKKNIYGSSKQSMARGALSRVNMSPAMINKINESLKR